MNPLEAIAIRLQRGPRLLLLLRCTRDGSIQRLGDGSPGSSDAALIVDRGHPECFAALEPLVTPTLRARAGRVYELPDKPGEPVELMIEFFDSQGSRALTFRYGSEGAAPPDEVRNLVASAVTASDSWYAAMRRA